MRWAVSGRGGQALVCLLIPGCYYVPYEWPDPTTAPLPEVTQGPEVPYHQSPASPADLPALVVTVEGIDGGTGEGGAFLPGDVLDVTYRLTDEIGAPWRIEEITKLVMVVSGPTSDYHPVFKLGDAPDILTRSESLGAGRYVYRFPVALPATYAAPYHNTDAFGPESGEAYGEPLRRGTYALLFQASIAWTFEDQIHKSEADGIFLFRVGSDGPLTPHAGLSERACVDCHTVGPEPNTDGASTRACMVCHTAGMEDGGSELDPSLTPGVTLDRRIFFHKLHMGAHLSQLPYEVRGAATAEEPMGLPYDFSFVDFPRWPGGAARCDACHLDDASDAWRTRPSRSSCGACHDAVVWSSGEGHEIGGPQQDDTRCAECHPSSGPNSIGVVHTPDVMDPELSTGLRAEILTVEPGTDDGGSLRPGDTVAFTFRLTDGQGAPLDPSSLSEARAFLSGPTTHLQPVFTYPSASDVASRATPAQGSTPEDPSWRYQFTLPLPDVFSAPLNDTESLGASDGEWQGLPLVQGTYLLGFYAARELSDAEGGTFREASPIAVVPLQVLGAAEVEPRPARVTNQSCGSCHGDVQHHKGSRRGVEGCVLCHVAGAEDHGSSEDPSLTEGVTIFFPSLIHKLHHGQLLNEGLVVSAQEGLKNFSDVLFPAWPDRTAQCLRCHTSDAWQKASAVPCLACHDSAAAAAHVSVNTAEGVEACDVCHGPGRDQAVGPAHGIY